MGIEGLNQFLVDNCKGCEVPLHRPHFNHLYIDVNNYLHIAGRKVTSKKVFFNKLNKQLTSLVRRVRCTNLILMVDGPGPYSKLIEQRGRRTKSILATHKERYRAKLANKDSDQKMNDCDDDEVILFQGDSTTTTNGSKIVNIVNGEELIQEGGSKDTSNNGDDEDFDNQDIEGEEDEEEEEEEEMEDEDDEDDEEVDEEDEIIMDSDAFSTTLLTPGTLFGCELKQFLIEFAKKLLSSKFIESVLISPTDAHGEGEWKIYDHITNSLVCSPTDTIGVVSNDTDLIVYSLLVNKPISVVRTGFQNTHIVNTTLRQMLARSITARSQDQVIQDFIFLTLCRGTDYLPQLGGFNFQMSWQKYIKSNSPVGIYNPLTGEINWDMLHEITYHTGTVRNGWHPKAKTLVGVLNECVSKLGSCLKKHMPVLYSFDADTGVTTLTIGTETYGSTNGQGPKVNNHLAKPLVNIKHEFWVKHWKSMPMTYRTEIKEDIESVRDPSSIDNSIKTVDNGTNLERLQKYFEGLVWNMKYVATQSQHYTFFYHYTHTPSILSLKKDGYPTLNLNIQDNRPLKPLQFCFSLSNRFTKFTINPIFHSLYNTLPHFNLRNKVIWHTPDCIENLMKSFDLVAKENMNMLTSEEKALLEFSPSLYLFKTHNRIDIQELTDRYQFVDKSFANRKQNRNQQHQHQQQQYQHQQQDTRYHPYKQQQQHNTQQQQPNIAMNDLMSMMMKTNPNAFHAIQNYQNHGNNNNTHYQNARQPCKYFAMGNCTKPDCRFSHDIQQPTMNINNNNNQQNINAINRGQKQQYPGKRHLTNISK